MKLAAYYILKPLIPRTLQIALRSRIALRKRERYGDLWPIDWAAGNVPERWRGWPDGKRFALILTHDVDTRRGHDRCLPLAALEEGMGFRSSFNFVPEKYDVSAELRHELSSRGFEIGVHDLHHDGKLYRSRELFRNRAKRINGYLNRWGAVGFRSGSMHHNLDWIHDLDIEYDSSTFDTDPFEAQPDGVGTIFPFFVNGNRSEEGYVELPYTLPQDFTLFILMGETDIGTWKTKLEWIADRGGMALLNTHPDYMLFRGKRRYVDEYSVVRYREFLQHVKREFAREYWHVLPRDVAKFIKEQRDIT